jgi:hypothetical protein
MTVFEIIPNIFELFAPAISKLGIKRFEHMDYYNEVFLLNSGKTLTLFILSFLFYIILKIVHLIAAKNAGYQPFRRF